MTKTPHSALGAWLLLALVATLLDAQAPASSPATDSVAVPTAAAASATQPKQVRRRSWTSDRRDFQKGDLLTVLVSERASAHDRSRKNDSYDRKTDASLGVNVDLPTPLPVDAASLGSDFGRSSRETNEVSRQESLVGEISVQVVEVLASGVLRIEGERQVNVDKHNKIMSLSGLVRAEDISPSGVVASTRIAEARIRYRGKQPLMRPGIFNRVFKWLWP